MQSPKAATLKATIGYDQLGETASLTSVTRGAPRPVVPVEVDELADTLTDAPKPSTPKLDATMGAHRTTVLPRRRRSAASDADWQIEQKPRFETLELLGRGGMGEVALAKDNDIRRTVAVKRILPDQRHGEAMLRFADEIRAVGQLEHPGIVPVYDVGVDENGHHYLVMKHVQGETLETVIEKLKRGDPDAVERFSYEHRAHIFFEILQAIRYAHDRGILHRDIKPANIMIGPFGEVTVMDWGIAKRIERHAPTSTPGDAKISTEGKLLETHHGALLGTPLYMSPEQAAGKNDDLDERSDIFSLCVLFYEMLTLEHPLQGIETVQDLLATLIAKDLDLDALGNRVLDIGVPVEYFQFLQHGLARDREKRFTNIGEMERRLRDILSGKITVYCHISLTKKLTHNFLHFVDRHPKGFTLIVAASLLAVLGLATTAIVRML